MNIREEITIEQASFIHRSVPTAVIGGAFVALVLATAFWAVADADLLLAWLGIITLVTVVRLWNWREYRARHFSHTDAQRWLRQAVTAAAVSGCVWGLGSLFLLPPGRMDYQFVFVFGVVMMTVAAIFSYNPHFPTYFAFFLPAVVPLIVGIAMQGTLVHAGIATGLAIYAVVALHCLWTLNRIYLQSQTLRFENVSLVEQLTVQKEAAEAANHAKSRFLAAASHDLRQPMHALNLYLGALGRMELPAEPRNLLGNVTQCAQTMDEMFRALLDISKLDAGAVQAETGVFAVAAMLDRIRMEFEPQVQAKGLTLRIVPSSALARGDPALVERILRNLVSNAVRYTQRGGILVGCRRRGMALRLAVYDTGPGIAPDQQRHVFEEFYQVGNPERDRSKGIGLGLAIVDRLARLMAAPVTLQSRPGHGSLFAIDLPGVAASMAAGQPLPAPTSVRRSLAGSLVMVIDDEEMILNATRGLLEQWHCTVMTATSGIDALEQLSMSPRAPDAVICDYRLRAGEDGITVLGALRSEFNEDIPALLVTGDTGPERLQAAQASGYRVLHKPLQEQQLRDALTRLLGVSTLTPA